MIDEGGKGACYGRLVEGTTVVLHGDDRGEGV